VVKSWFKNFEKFLSKSLKKNERKGIEKKEKKRQTDHLAAQPIFSFFCAAQISAAQTTSRPANSLSPLSRH
jgi:hypothetical protein